MRSKIGVYMKNMTKMRLKQLYMPIVICFYVKEEGFNGKPRDQPALDHTESVTIDPLSRCNRKIDTPQAK